MRTIKSQSVSVALHLAVLAIGFLIGSRNMIAPIFNPQPQRPAPLYFTPPRVAPVTKSQISGGANAGVLPARRGTPPPRSIRTFIPPLPRQPQPKLPLTASIAYEVPPLLAPDGIGDPLSRVNTGSLGAGGQDGIGDHGCCRGIGPDQGGPGLSVRASMGTMTPARLISKIEPEFSEEARKAKFQGTVVLVIEVDSAGNAGNFRVVSSPGLGLDRKAIEAVAQWRFRPAYRDGKPVVSSARVEVNFRLL